MSAEQLATAKGAVSCKRLFDAHERDCRAELEPIVVQSEKTLSA